MRLFDDKKALYRLLLAASLLVFWGLAVVPLRAETVVPPQPTGVKTDLVLNLLPGGYYDRIQAGQETHLYLEIRNSGSTNITGLHFNAGLPEGWSVRFVPEEMAVLTAGSSDTLEAFLTPAKNAGGSYNVTFMAAADQTRAATSAYFNVKSGSNFWLWVGIGIGVVVIAGFIWIFLRFGKN